MFQVILAYLILPFVLSWAVIKFLRAYSKTEVPQDIQALYAHKPVARGAFRVVKKDAHRAAVVEDCPSRDEALEIAYRAMRRCKETGEKATFLVLNHEGAAFSQIDS